MNDIDASDPLVQWLLARPQYAIYVVLAYALLSLINGSLDWFLLRPITMRGHAERYRWLTEQHSASKCWRVTRRRCMSHN